MVYLDIYSYSLLTKTTLTQRNDTPNIGLPSEQDHKLDNWFSVFIDNLKTDHLLLTSKVASEEKLVFIML